MAYTVSTMAAPGASKRGAILHQRRQAGEQVPHLAVGAATELRRIDEDDVIGLAAPHLAGDELRRIIQHPADRRRLQSRRGLVLLRPGDRLLRRIDVRDVRAGSRGDQRGGAGVGEQVQHARRFGALLGQPRQHPLPVRHLLGKQTHVAEARQAAKHRRRADLHRPAFRHRLVDAPTALFLVVVAGEHRMRMPPLALGRRRRPQRLRLRAVDDDGPEALELAPAAAVEQRVVREAGRLDELQPRGSVRCRLARVISASMIFLRHGQRLGASHRRCKAISRVQPAPFMCASAFGPHNKPALSL